MTSTLLLANLVKLKPPATYPPTLILLINNFTLTLLASWMV